VYVTDSVGCYGTADILVKVYSTKPDIFVPTAFTPNNDGRNDIIKAIPVGVKEFDYFTIYNRFGQVIFTTKDASKGWNGYFNGIDQPVGTYVFVTRGIDYTGTVIFKKGTIVLIR
jgi:gliding motility-associated-like protein